MSDDAWKKAICQPSTSASIVDINRYVCEVTADEESLSPIDSFYKHRLNIIQTGTNAFLTLHPELGSLLLIRAISITENYFREIFSRAIKICPIAQKNCSEKSIPLSSVLWHKDKDIERGALEGQSLAESNKITKISKEFLGCKLEDHVGEQILKDFESLCQLRHNIVHSACIVAGKNAVNLSIPPRGKRINVIVKFRELQEALSICSSLVIEANKSLFIHLSKNWAVEWRKLPSWNPTKEYYSYKAIWDIFYSDLDAGGQSIEEVTTPIKCKNAVAKFFGS